MARGAGKRGRVPVLAAAVSVWLAACHLAPYLPPGNPFGTAFGLAPPLFLVALPGLVLLVFLYRLFRRREARLNGALAFGTVLLSFPLLGFAWNVSVSEGGRERMRVMTFNVHKDSREMPELLDFAKGSRVDVLFLQENKGGERSLAAYMQRNLPGWHRAEAGEVAILSRWPIEDVRDVRMWSRDTRSILAAEIAGPRRFRAATVHWSVPQFSKGLGSVRNGARRQVRDFEQTRDVVRGGDLPTVFGGDFNNTPRHGLTRRLSSGYENCFSVKGNGFGWTYPSSRSLVRIDHLYVDEGFRTLRADVGPDLGSDHLPLVAELAFR